MKRWGLVVLALAGFGAIAFADSLEPFGFVKQVTEQDGDTITTSQATCACTAGCAGPAALLSASQTAAPGSTSLKTNRRRAFRNTAAFEIFIGTQTANASLTGTGFRLDASTGVSPTFYTYSSAAFYCEGVGATSGTVTVLQETNATP